MKENPCFASLPDAYLFRETGEAVAAAERARGRPLLRLGVGDVAYPLSRPVVRALCRASREMGDPARFRGYPPTEGYPFLREAVARFYADRGIAVTPESVVIGDGAKSDGADFLTVTGAEEILLPTPAYPVYADAAVLAGRRVVRVPTDLSHGFLPVPPDSRHTGAVIVLISPNNPCGVAYPRALLEDWVAYARENDACVLFDSSYFAFLRPGGVRSIYEIPGAREVAAEVGSFSKFAGFTGLRCSYLILPDELRVAGRPLRYDWLRRQSTRFNGVSYVVQRAAEAALSPPGRRAWEKTVARYAHNARLLADALTAAGIPFTGGQDSPYLFAACPPGQSSRAFFARLLAAGVATTPGDGFGIGGEGFIRLSALCREETARAAALVFRALA